MRDKKTIKEIEEDKNLKFAIKSVRELNRLYPPRLEELEEVENLKEHNTKIMK